MDIIWLAGYPCQPFSSAGNRKGTDAQGICGPTSQTELHLIVSQAQSSSRTSKDTLPLGCVTSCATWDEWVTEQRGECLARLQRAFTNVQACVFMLEEPGGFPTPVVGDSWTPSSEASTIAGVGGVSLPGCGGELADTAGERVREPVQGIPVGSVTNAYPHEAIQEEFSRCSACILHQELAAARARDLERQLGSTIN